MDGMERIAVRKGSLGEGMEVARALPTRGRRMIGAWCFLDHLGPVDFPAGAGLHVGAHPHTRLQTFTWMVEGEILHRDSLGSEQVVRAGQVNLMTAGHGISHTEDSVRDGQRLHAAQLWIALPEAVAEQAPAFAHYPEVPQWQAQGCQWSLMVGDYGSYHAPTQVHTPLIGLELHAPQGAQVTLNLRPDFEYGLLPLHGSVAVADEAWDAHTLVYLAQGPQSLVLRLQPNSRVLLIGGQPFAEHVAMWWNFLGPDLQSIRSYRAQWNAGDARFGEVPGAPSRRMRAPDGL